MTSRVFQFNRQQGSDPNPTQFFQRVNAFAAGFKPDQAVSLLMVHHGTSIGNYLILHSDKIQESAALPLAHAVAAHEVFDARAILTNPKVLGHVPYRMRAGEQTAILGTPMQRAGAKAPVLPHVRPDKAGRVIRRGGADKRGWVASLPERLRIF